MNKLIHKIKHYFGWNTGTCDSFYQDGKLFMSFKCDECGERFGIHPIDDFLDKELKK